MRGWLTTLIGHHAYRPWLTVEGSLTQALRAHCPHLRLLRLRQEEDRPHADELAPLSLPRGRLALVREVLLVCREHPVVFAHSVIPMAGLQGPWRGLFKLGQRPLGEALFADPAIQRRPMQYRRLDGRHPLYRAATRWLDHPPAALWARRSVFLRAGSPILVTEVFLPAVLRMTAMDQQEKAR
ncbi:MAG: chorismate lyase [Thiobacillaceae bacterium]|nr:chorismate lyase [Thiobacillaceae bacterium]